MMGIADERRVVAGRYDVLREIGRGGMGAVWLGRDTLLGRDVALKRIGLVPGAESPDLERAEREARLAARLNHPHVVAIFDLVDEGEETWLVMEYVEGVTLSALVARDGALTPDEAAPFLRQAADALGAAHRAGIVHRDVKPSNMLVTPTGALKLTDFGIARAEADATLTRTGLVTGSPSYLAPEVASGASATEASDVWSLGASLFHLLAGRPPYDVREGNLIGALYTIVHEEPPRLAEAGWLAPLLERTMTREPADRWPMTQVREFLDQREGVTLRPAAASAPVEPSTTPHRTQSLPMAVPPVEPDSPVPPARGTPRSPWPWVAAVAVLLAVGALVAAVWAGTHGSSPAANPATHSSSGGTPPTGSTSSGSGATAAGIRSFITTYLATVTSDDRAAFGMLTPSFQRQSGGFGGYDGFWSTIAQATPRDIVAQPASSTVSYTVDYTKVDGGHATDHVTLELVPHGSSYLIAGEL